MQKLDDMTLLRDYAARNSEVAFEELVSRRIGFVYSAALRQVNDPHLAQEITQAVFVILAQKAHRISKESNLAGWLFKTTRFVALAQRRASAMRRQHEQEFQMQADIFDAAPDPVWALISPYLDEALMCLGAKDRQTVLLHYFDKKSFAEVGALLGMSEVAARKRSDRALDKLRTFLSKRAVASTAAAIAMAIGANSVHAAPVGMAATISATAIKGSAVAGSTLALVKGALELMAWAKAKTAIVVSAGVLLAAGTASVTVKEIEHYRENSIDAPVAALENETLDQSFENLLTNRQFELGRGNYQTGLEEILSSRRAVKVLQTLEGMPQTDRIEQCRELFRRAMQQDRELYDDYFRSREEPGFSAPSRLIPRWAIGLAMLATAETGHAIFSQSSSGGSMSFTRTS